MKQIAARTTTLSRKTSLVKRWESFFIPSHIGLVVIVAGLSLGLVLGILVAFITTNMFSPTNTMKIAEVIGVLSPVTLWGIVIGTLLMALLIFFRQDEIMAVVVVVTHLYLDWYLGATGMALIMTLALLLIFYLARSLRHTWTKPRALWLWGLFLALGIFPAIRGGSNLYDALFYYPNLIFGALLLFWLGTVVARTITSVQLLFQLLSIIGTLLAIHTIIQGLTGIFLLGSSRFDLFLATVSNFRSGDIGVFRLGSFFVDPNWNGAYLAMMLCIALGLFVTSRSLLGKVLYLAEMFLIASALLFTYSGGAAVATIAGITAFVVFAGRTISRIQIPLFIVVVAIGITLWFPTQFSLLLQHATEPSEVMLRTGAWQTALAVICAFPLTGVGLGLAAYQERAEPYRVAAQYVPLAHPHNSYLEFGAMAGLPFLITFIALLLFALWLAWCNWTLVDVRTRSLLGGGIAAVVALSVNSFSINGWTLPPLAAIGWFILGIISSPLLTTNQRNAK